MNKITINSLIHVYSVLSPRADSLNDNMLKEAANLLWATIEYAITEAGEEPHKVLQQYLNDVVGDEK